MDAYGLADIPVPAKQPKLPGMELGDVAGEEDKPDESETETAVEKTDIKEGKK
jgi:hypothetical protein